MAEGVAAGGKTLTRGVHDDPERPPPPSADAPKGWTWNRGTRSWQPKQRGELLWRPEAATNAAARFKPPAEPQPDSGWFKPPEPPPLPEIPGERDPDPRHLSDEAPPDGKLKLADVPQAVKDDIAGLAGLVGTPILAVLQSMDPYCGGAIADAYEGIVDATLPLICRSEKIVKYFSEDKADWLLWGKLALALGPVAKAIGEHHILHTVEVVKDPKTGATSIVRKVPGQPQGDALQPPAAPEFNYAA